MKKKVLVLFGKRYSEVMENIADKNNNLFWPSYVDLITGLFAITLILFVFSYKLFKDKENQLRDEIGKTAASAKQYERITNIDNKIKALENTGRFKYDEQYRRFLVKDFIGEEIFEPEKDIIKSDFLDV